jgi:hypothetical protein
MHSPTAELRRQYRAARHIERADALRARLEERTARAADTLRYALAISRADRTTVPGYAVWRSPDGSLHVQPVEPTDAAQLALWREITKGAQDE